MQGTLMGRVAAVGLTAVLGACSTVASGAGIGSISGNTKTGAIVGGSVGLLTGVL